MEKLPQLVKEIPQRKIDAYSGVRPNYIHSDEAFARKRGFPAPLAQAMMSTAYVSELMTRFLWRWWPAPRTATEPLRRSSSIAGRR